MVLILVLSCSGASVVARLAVTVAVIVETVAVAVGVVAMARAAWR